MRNAKRTNNQKRLPKNVRFLDAAWIKSAGGRPNTFNIEKEFMELLFISQTYITTVRRDKVFHPPPYEKKLNVGVYCEMSTNHFLLCHLLWKELRDSLEISYIENVIL